MINKLITNGIYVKKSPISGYGVFAGHALKPGEVIEEARVLVYEPSKCLAFDHYHFEIEEKLGGISLGYGSLYNHSSTPNTHFSYDAVRGLMIYTADRAIAAGEELLINYGDKWLTDRGIREYRPLCSRLRHFFKKDSFFKNNSVRFVFVVAALSLITYGLRYLLEVFMSK